MAIPAIPIRFIAACRKKIRLLRRRACFPRMDGASGRRAGRIQFASLASDDFFHLQYFTASSQTHAVKRGDPPLLPSPQSFRRAI
jgi:hypothetical protein